MRKKQHNFIVFLLPFLLLAFHSFPVHAENEPVVVVIDPGHGGENLGADYEGYLEKEMTLITANAMYEELLKYDGIEVYMTRTDDKDLTLAERAEYAAGVNADLLAVLHFNMSENHNLFGSEVWISAFGEDYQKGYAFGEAVLAQFDTLGSYRRGVKTRLNDDGEDYYGSIREARARNVTAALIEHCHVDNEKGTVYCDTEEKLKTLGKLDATAVAQYFGLSSSVLGTDYSDYEKAFVELPSSVVRPDETPPEICYIELIEADKESRKIKLRLSAQDSESGMLYYSYSTDGGTTFSPLKEWPEADTFRFSAEVPNGITPHIVVNAYNGYDLFTASNEIAIEGFPLVSNLPEEESIPSTKETAETVPTETLVTVWEEESVSDKESEEGADRSFAAFLKISGICIGILLILLWGGYSYLGRKRQKRKRKF